MKKVLLIPDSFKGTMSSAEICDCMAVAITTHYPGCEILRIPVADGGEGSVDAFLAAVGGERIAVTVKGPYMQDMPVYYGMLPDGTAVLEMACCAGLPLVENNKDPRRTTTYGVGQLLLHAAQHGAKRLVVGLGGSCTNDMGAGAPAAAGVRFHRADGSEFVPTGGTLSDIAQIDMAGLAPELKGIPITAMCDIDNPLSGTNGAAHIFGPQKGADEAAVRQLDDGLKKAAAVVKQQLGMDIDPLPGAGAAGGMGGGMQAFFGAELQMGIQTVLDTINYEVLLQGADMVFTGEGKIDTQSLRGKVVLGVSRRTKPHGVPVFAIVGDIGDNIEAVYEQGVTGVFSINRVAVDFSKARLRSADDLRLTMDNLMRVLKACGK